VDPAIIAFHDRYSAISEQYRSVQARLLTMNTARVPQVIAVTSAIPEEGKSVSAVNLSLVMAEGGEHRILLADGDFRRTCIARMLGIPDKPGLAEVLSGEVSLNEALQSTPLPNLKVLPAGKVRDSAYAELLGGPATATVLSDLRSAFDYTFLDTPPITTVSDVCLLAPRCDGAMIVIQMRRTPEPTVQQAVRALQANNVKVIGCILSRFQERGAGYYERYYSYYYYR
jgi:receptor protein-tyrosine kinase